MALAMDGEIKLSKLLYLNVLNEFLLRIDGLRDIAESRISDLQMRFAANRFSISPPATKEAYLYREIFSKHFPSPSAAKTVPEQVCKY